MREGPLQQSFSPARTQSRCPLNLLDEWLTEKPIRESGAPTAGIQNPFWGSRVACGWEDQGPFVLRLWMKPFKRTLATTWGIFKKRLGSPVKHSIQKCNEHASVNVLISGTTKSPCQMLPIQRRIQSTSPRSVKK